MNKKGFTLIELLAVIVILALLALLTSTAITKLVKDSKDELSDTQKELIKSAAEVWGADNINKLPNAGTCGYLTLKDLKEYGVIDSKVIDPSTSQPISDDLIIKITSESNSYGIPKTIYEVDTDSVEDCSRIKIIVCGDVNLDNIVDDMDADLLNNYITAGRTFKEKDLKIYDTNGDDEITNADVLEIRNFADGTVLELSCPE